MLGRRLKKVLVILKRFWRRLFPMFICMDIHMTEPICDCLEQNLSWNVNSKDEKGRSTLTIVCETCGTELRIPYEKFRAAFKLKTAYPGKPKTDPKNQPSAGEVVELRPNKVKN